MTQFFDLAGPRLLAHRGASVAFPENSLPAFREALRHVPYLELDVRASADGQLVVHHDETLHRSCGVARPVAELTWEELRKLALNPPPGFDEDESYGLCRLEELFAALPEARFNVEIKQRAPSVVNAVMDLIVKMDLVERCLVTAEDDHTMLEIRNRRRVDRKLDALATGVSLGEGMAFLHWLQRGGDETFALEGRALQVPESFAGVDLCTPEIVRAAHALGVEVHYWVINDEHRMRELLDMGADGIMSDYPDRLARVAKEWARDAHATRDGREVRDGHVEPNGRVAHDGRDRPHARVNS